MAIEDDSGHISSFEELEICTDWILQRTTGFRGESKIGYLHCPAGITVVGNAQQEYGLKTGIFQRLSFRFVLFFPILNIETDKRISTKDPWYRQVMRHPTVFLLLRYS